MSKPNPTQACVKNKDICDMTTEEAKKACGVKSPSYYQTIYPAEWMLADMRIHSHMTDEALRAAYNFFVLLDRMESRAQKDYTKHHRQFDQFFARDSVQRAILLDHKLHRDKLLEFIDKAKKALIEAIVLFAGNGYHIGSLLTRFSAYTKEAEQQEQAKENDHE